MTNGMTHEEAREALDALALDALDASERAAVLAHVASCESCRAELEEARDNVRSLVYAAPAVAIEPVQRDRMRARLIARAAADRPQSTGNGAAGIVMPTAAAPVIPASTPVSPITAARSARAANTAERGKSYGWYAAAASLVAAASLAGLLQTRGERDTLRESLQTAAASDGARRTALDSLTNVLVERDRQIANLTGPEVAVVTLASAVPTAPTARMFWDQSVNAWTFVAHRLPALKAGRTYQLWLVTGTAKISAGTFAPNATGDAVVRATYALDRNALAAVAVTEEPESGSAQPTSVPFIVGATAAQK